MEPVLKFVETGAPQNVEQWVTALTTLLGAVLTVWRLVTRKHPQDDGR